MHTLEKNGVDRETMEMIGMRLQQASTVEQVGQILYQMRAEFEAEGNVNPFEMLLMKLGQRFPNPDEVSLEEVGAFIGEVL